MTQVSLHGNPCHTSGELPEIGSMAPQFKLTDKNMSDLTLDDFAGKNKVLSIVPSFDTPTCAMSMREFNKRIAAHDNVSMLAISADLPFAQSRFCTTEGIENVQALSTFRSNFGKDYGIELVDGPLAGVTARAVLVLDKNNEVKYQQLVEDIADEPDYQQALQALQDL